MPRRRPARYAFVVPGVGVYNAAAGLATAYACSSPVLLLAGQVNRDGIGRDLGLLHDVHDQLEIVRPVTKRAERVLDPTRIPARSTTPSTRWRRAGRGRSRWRSRRRPWPRARPTSSSSTREPVPAVGGDPELVRMLRPRCCSRAGSPLVVAGGGVNLGDASGELRAVAEQSAGAGRDDPRGQGRDRRPPPLAVGTMWINRRLRPVHRRRRRRPRGRHPVPGLRHDRARNG